MYSYEDRLRAVQLYIKLGKRIGLTICQLGYPTKNALKTWHREYEQRLDLPAAHADRQALDLREDHLVLAVRVGRPPALQGRLPARPAGIQQSVCLGWQVCPRAGSGQADREAGPPGAGGLPQAVASRFDRGGKRTRSAVDGAVGLQQTRALSAWRWSYCEPKPLLRARP